MKRTARMLAFVLAAMMILGALCAAKADGGKYADNYGANMVVITHNQMVNVRSGSGTEYRVVDTAYPGNAYRYLGTTRMGWYVVEMDSGMVGCISPNMAQLVYDSYDPTYSGTCSHRTGYVHVNRPNGGYIDMHVQRNANSNLLRHVYSGTYECVAYHDGWYTIICNGYMGYVHEYDVTFTENRANTYTPHATGVVWINTQDMVNVRRGNNQYTDLALSVCPDASFLCLGKDPQTGWYQILLPDGTMGFISNKLCEYTPLGNG